MALIIITFLYFKNEKKINEIETIALKNSEITKIIKERRSIRKYKENKS